jgi:hypothetical protein
LPIVTAATLVKFDPRIVIIVPKPPVIGEKEVMAGGGR